MDIATSAIAPNAWPTMRAQNLVIQGERGPMVTINLVTGGVEFGEDYTLDEAAKIFWQGIAGKSGC